MCRAWRGIVESENEIQRNVGGAILHRKGKHLRGGTTRVGRIVLGERTRAILNNVSPLNRLKSWDASLPIFDRSIQENSLAAVRRVDGRKRARERNSEGEERPRENAATKGNGDGKSGRRVGEIEVRGHGPLACLGPNREARFHLAFVPRRRLPCQRKTLGTNDSS